MSSNCKIGAEDANAPMAMCGYFILNQAASTERERGGNLFIKNKK
jgi:hypothetical protein